MKGDSITLSLSLPRSTARDRRAEWPAIRSFSVVDTPNENHGEMSTRGSIDREMRERTASARCTRQSRLHATQFSTSPLLHQTHRKIPVMMCSHSFLLPLFFFFFAVLAYLRIFRMKFSRKTSIQWNSVCSALFRECVFANSPPRSPGGPLGILSSHTRFSVGFAFCAVSFFSTGQTAISLIIVLSSFSH